MQESWLLSVSFALHCLDAHCTVRHNQAQVSRQNAACSIASEQSLQQQSSWMIKSKGLFADNPSSCCRVPGTLLQPAAAAPLVAPGPAQRARLGLYQAIPSALKRVLSDARIRRAHKTPTYRHSPATAAMTSANSWQQCIQQHSCCRSSQTVWLTASRCADQDA
jgi:hypothetical protein